MAKLYKHDGTVKDVEPKNKKEGFGLQELYDLIECEMIQPVVYAPGKVFICDEEFRLREDWEEKRNKTANDLIINETGDNWDLCGNVIICDTKEFPID